MSTKHVLREARVQLRRYRHRLNDETRRSIESEIERLQEARTARRKEDARKIAKSLVKKVREHAPKTFWHHTIETVESLAVAIVVALAIRQFIVEPFKIPTGSMEPTLHGSVDKPVPHIGDFIMVNKSAYGPKIPFTNRRLWTVKPKRWDIAVFTTNGITTEDGRLAASDPPRNFVKRIVGLPGETLEIRDGWLYVDGEQMEMPPYLEERLTEESERTTPYVLPPDRPHVYVKTYYKINLLGLHVLGYLPKGRKATVTRTIPADGVGEITYETGMSRHVARARNVYGETVSEGSLVLMTDESEEVVTVRPIHVVVGPWPYGHDREPFIVPEGHYFMMGDNSPASADSRAWGFVPFENLKGRVVCVWYPVRRWRTVK